MATKGATVSSHHALSEPQNQDTSHETMRNRATPNVPFYTPLQSPPAGTATSANPVKLFQPLKLRGVTLQNRIMLSPLCQYSADYGHHTLWHLTHLGGIIQRGPGLSMVEATSVTPEGRITPEDSGLWQDSQIEPLKRIVDFAHSQSQHIAIQLAHAGRKASTVAPWLSSGEVAGEDVGGWPDRVVGPSPIPWNENHAPVKEMSLQDIEDFKAAFVASVKRALTAGFDVIEIHNAHGYLLHEFLSPVANKRTDKYGGSFENRTRLTREVVQLVRANIPESMPLLMRISGTDFLEDVEGFGKDSWTVDDTVNLAPTLAELGVDLLDVSGGGNHPKQHPHVGPGYQAPFAKAVKERVGDKMAVGTVGAITDGKQANQLLEEGLDLVICGRAFQKNPGLVWKFAEDTETQIQIANQIRWGFGGRGGGQKK